MTKTIEQIEAEEIIRKDKEKKERLKAYRNRIPVDPLVTIEALAKRKAGSIGVIGIFSIHGIDVHIKVIDVKNEHGHFCYLVQPIAGSGATWVRTLKPIPDEKI